MINMDTEIIIGEPPIEPPIDEPSIEVGEPVTPPTENLPIESEPVSSEVASDIVSSEPLPPPLTASDIIDIINSTSSDVVSFPVEEPVSSEIIVEPFAFDKPFTDYTVQDFCLFGIFVIASIALTIYFTKIFRNKGDLHVR